MSPEYEGPQDDDGEGVAPRRVRHLIVLPGGGSPGDDVLAEPDNHTEPTDDPARAPDGAPDRARDEGNEPERRAPDVPRFLGPAGSPASSVGAAAAAVQVAEALPLEVPQPFSLRVKLKVISRSVTSTKAPGMPFIIFASVLVGLAILMLVVLRVMVDQASFRVDSLESQVTKQQAQLRQLAYAVSVQEAPGRVAALAAQAGLVPSSQVQTLVGAAVAGGTVTSTASAPAAGPSPRSTTPSPQPRGGSRTPATRTAGRRT